jgi:hypothetical protein
VAPNDGPHAPHPQPPLLADFAEAQRRIVAIGDKPKESGGFTIIDAVALGVGFVNPLAWAYLAGKKVVEAATTGSDPGVLFVPMEAIDRRLYFPVGHPVPHGVYAANPARPWLYFTMAEFHAHTLRDKVAELFCLLSALRAEKVEISVVRAESTSFGLHLDATMVGDVPVKVERRLGTSALTATEVAYRARFAGAGPPSLPDNLRWFLHEPEWQAIANGRLQHGLTDFNIMLRYSDHFGVTAKLGAKLEDLGFSIGGTFGSLSTETWTLTGRFPRKPLFGW